MRIELPEFAEQKELFQYLYANKSDLIAQKKSLPITSVPMGTGVLLNDKGEQVTKANKPVTGDVNELNVRIVCNTANWMDSHNDVLLNDGAKKYISERKNMIPHLHDHIHQLMAKVGIPSDIKLEDLSFKDLGISGYGNGITQAVVMYSTVKRALNESVFEQYKNAEINQHSVGLQYVKLRLAINDEDFKSEFETWNSFFPEIINKDKAEEKQFFWAIQEWKMLENSAVLFGSNEITPTLDNDLKQLEPSPDTPIQPSNDTDKAESKKQFLINTIKNKQ